MHSSCELLEGHSFYAYHLCGMAVYKKDSTSWWVFLSQTPRPFESMEPYMQIANSRGGRALIIGNYRYVVNKERERRVYWRCARRGCNVYVTWEG